MDVLIGMPLKDRAKRLEYSRKYNKEHNDRPRGDIMARKRRIAAWLFEYKKTLKCQECPENYPRCLDFHHLDEKKKRACVSNLVHRGCGKETILKEIDKCIVLCSNCHRKRTLK